MSPPFRVGLPHSFHLLAKFPRRSGGAGVEDAIEHLARQLAEPIRWMDCMDAIAEQGITAALELGPGSALSKMLSARHPRIECRSAADFRTLDGIRRWLERIA